jgi:sialate O-acetylesterase
MSKIVRFLAIILINVISTFVLNAQVKLPRLISNGMVLQRDADVKIWGWAAPGEAVAVEFRDNTYRTTATESGEWEITITPVTAGGPHSMTIRASNTIMLDDIYFGEVWICSGQSNMELPMSMVSPLYQEEINQAHYPLIRHFAVPQKYNFNEPLKDLDGGSWKLATPTSVNDFSAVAFFFARELHQKYNIPIGLINTSLGGSPAESWMSEQALEQFPEHLREAQRFKDASLIQRIEQQDRQRIDAWYKQADQNDAGYQSTPWHHPGINTRNWSNITVPGYWADGALGPVNGVVWYRKDFTIRANAAGKAAKLNLGNIVDADSVFINGVFVATTSYQYPPRRYEIPAGLLKKGKNNITIRVINNTGRGGFVPDKDYEIITADNRIDLRGQWKYKSGTTMEPLAPQTFIRWKPLGLYNAMLFPLLNYHIRGVIWYQGESNTGRPKEYAELFPAMIQDWRNSWNQGDFPFLYVQLANFMPARSEPSESNWAMLRESQLKTLSVPNTAMAVTIDIGEWNDIHPLNKKDVGVRLALAAQKVACHDEQVVASGPIYKDIIIEGNKALITFHSTGSGLMAKGDRQLKGFAVAGKDGRFVWAQARIENNRVVVWSDKVSEPVAVRYAWADNPHDANLYNVEGLPASPFRTDTFEK